MRVLRPMMLFAAATLIASCDENPTEPVIALIETPGRFVATVSGDVSLEIDGEADFTQYLSGPGLVVALVNDGTAHSVQFNPGVLLASPTFDFPVDRHSLAGFPGMRDLDGTFLFSNAGVVAFVATSGYLEVVESTAERIRGRFDFTGQSASEAGTQRIRVRGSFWATPVL